VEYSVSAKTIRDIWNCCTWVKATRDLWTAEDMATYLEQRRRMSARLDPARNPLEWCPKEEEEEPHSRSEADTEVEL